MQLRSIPWTAHVMGGDMVSIFILEFYSDMFLRVSIPAMEG